MLFNSINYFLFLSAVFILNYIVPDRFRWILLLLASTFFYMIAGVATIIVPIVIILSTFICGILIERSSKTSRKKTYFLLGLFINLGLLVFFKCINFFIATAFNGFNFINRMVRGEQAVNHTPIILQLVVPLGISYITFQAIGYLIEINRGNQNSEKNLGLFATYLMFFPKLLSGPIERAHNFIPQLRQKHEFNYEQVVEGLKRILWGLFLKLVVANRLALYTDAVFNNFGQHSGITLLVASIFFTIQLFADFAGYTDMAIGSAQILGYRLMENFNSPFIAESITEFWRRWHISLTTWVNEYIYNPIVINCRSWNKWAVVFAAMVTFLILGFWHGASWNYIIFGFLQGIALSVEFLSRRFRKRVRSKIPTWLNTVLGISFTFGYFTFSLIFFKVATVKDAFYIVGKIFINIGATIFTGDIGIFVFSLMGIFLLILNGFMCEYFPKFKLLHNNNKYIRFFSILFLLMYIVSFGVFDGSQFIYFKF
jgi:alginate O-acetyltransferase complex protein AlgI